MFDKDMANNTVKKVLTLKSGQFVFSGKFSRRKLDDLLIEEKILYKTVVDLPILPELATRLKEEAIIKSIFSTAAIEGNPLTEERVSEIISEGDVEKRRERAEKEIRNLKSAYDFITSFELSESPFELTENIVRKLHCIITKDIKHEHNIPGHYRKNIVKVGDTNHGGIYTPPKILEDVEILMKEFMQWINSKESMGLDPAIRAALAHYHLGLIHPFGDGNGRTARAVEALLLQLAGIKYVSVMLSNFYYRNLDDYFWAFSNSRKHKKNDMTPFLQFVLQGYIECLNEIKEKITFYIRKFTLRDYYANLRKERHITERQHDFLIVLLDYPNPFVLEDLQKTSPLNILYRNVSERTARRDLKKLCGERLLLAQKGKYELNFQVLG